MSMSAIQIDMGGKILFRFLCFDDVRDDVYILV